jgi:hypothetical protein
MTLTKVGRSAGLFVVLLLGSFTLAWGDMQDFFKKIRFNTSLQGMYDSNIERTQDNPLSDFITTISAGIGYVDSGPAYKFNLGFDVGLNFYASYSNNNYANYNGHLNTYYNLTSNWTIGLYETVTYSQTNLESYSYPTSSGDQNNTSSTTGQGPYLRNIFLPSLEYKFGRENLAGLRYLNMIYRTEGSANSQDSMENSIIPSLRYWFNIRHGIMLDYAYTKAQFQNQSTQPNWVGNDLGGRYLYRFNPQTTAFGDYRYLVRDFDPPGSNYSVNSLSLGLTHSFSPTLTGEARFGWFWQQVEAGSPLNGPVYELSITQRVQRTSYNLAFRGGFREQYFTSTQQGGSEYNQAQLNVTYQLWERLSVGLTGTITRDEYQNPAYVDWSWGLAGNIAHKPLKWLTVSFVAGNYGYSSDVNRDSYRDNQISLRLIAEY